MTEINLPNCDNPQKISSPIGPESHAKSLRRCGHCYSCKMAKVHKKQGQFVAESLHPLHEAWREPGWMHFLTLTLRDEALTHTEPLAHDLTRSWDQSGPYSGPWPRAYRPLGRERFGVTLLEGIPYWWNRHKGITDPLTEGELYGMHYAYLNRILGWPSEAIEAWEDGRYGAMPTLVRSEFKAYQDRLRIWFRRTYPDLPMFRFAACGEYGDLRHRPHYHVILFGWPPHREALEYLAYAWQGFTLSSRIDPDPFELIHRQASWLDLERGAAHYAAKDVAKSRRDLRRTPAMAARAEPFQAPSKYPPLGQVAMENWLEATIIPILDAAGPSEMDQCYAARKAYTQFGLFVPSSKNMDRMEHFTTSDHWRSQVETLFDPDVWTETTWRLNKESAKDLRTTPQEVIDEHIEATGAKNRSNEARAKARKRRKAVRQLSPGL